MTMMMRMSLFSLVVAGALSAFAWYRPDYGWPIMAALALWTFLGVSIDLTLIRTDLALIRDRWTDCSRSEVGRLAGRGRGARGGGPL